MPRPIEAHAPQPLSLARPLHRSSLNHLRIPALLRHQCPAGPNPTSVNLYPASLLWDLYGQPNLVGSGPLLHDSSFHLLTLSEVNLQDVNPLELDDSPAVTSISEPRSVGRWNICSDFEEGAEQSHGGTSSPYGEAAFTRGLCPHGHFQRRVNGLDAYRRRGRVLGQYQESKVPVVPTS